MGISSLLPPPPPPSFSSSSSSSTACSRSPSASPQPLDASRASCHPVSCRSDRPSLPPPRPHGILRVCLMQHLEGA
eukprot:77317-Hanusia_phi.AAC.1